MNDLSDEAVRRLRAGLIQPELPVRYQLRDIIGRGGMGVVWRAHDGLLGRDVAVKVIAEHIDGAEFTRRIEREAKILARLEHPGVVAVHDTGTLDDGRGWYAMRLIRGDRLDQAATQFGTVGDAVRVMLRLVDAVAFAHAQGIVHRDLTPRNVMLGPFGEVLVLDWGVAHDGGRPEVAGLVIGTPGYMAPEQAAGQPADSRSDVFGLGAILRDLLSIRPEWAAPPLLAIRDRAMASAPTDRYPDAVSFGADLRHFQDGEAVSAYREGMMGRAARVVRQYRTPIVLVLAYLVMRVVVLWWKGL
ncbi:MAG: serine/threonine-protein kinase [Gemmatimonadales bacterium]